MNVGINLLFLIPGQSGGTETYIRNILNHYTDNEGRHRIFLFIMSEAEKEYEQYSDKMKVVKFGGLRRSKFIRILFEQLILPFYIFSYKIETLFSPGYVAPIMAPCAHVVTIHDLLFLRFPEMLPPAKRLYWNIFVPLTFLRAKVVIAVSHFVKSEFLSYKLSHNIKFVVIPEAVDTKLFYISPYDNKSIENVYLPEPFVVCVATISPHKNLECVLQAIHHLQKQGENINVVFVGNKERSIQSLERLSTNLQIKDKVFYTGFVEIESLRRIYSSALAFIMPSLYEGFGLPVLEAMACGCPVICSNAASLPEVAGDAAMFFNPYQPKELSQNILKLINSPQEKQLLRERGVINISRFDWSVTSKMTFQTLFNT